MPNFQSDGLSLYYEIAGDGVPIVLVHGFASSLTKNWREPGWFDELARAGFQVTALDNRGHGRSAKPHDPDAYDTDLMALDSVALMDHLGISTAHYFGYSMGALIGLRALALAPHRFRSAILAGIGENAARPAQPLQKLADAMRAADSAALTDPVQIAFRAFAESQPNDLSALAACAERPRRAAHRQDYQGLNLPPVLVLAGEADDMARHPEHLAAELPGASTCIIPRRNHMTAVGDKQTKQAVLAFLAGK